MDASKQGGAKILLVLGLVLLLVLIGGGVALFAFKDQIFHLAFNKTDTNQKTTEGQGADKIVSAPSSENQEPSVTPSNSPENASTPDSSSSNDGKAVVAPTETPLPFPSPTVEQEKRKAVVQATPPRSDREPEPHTRPDSSSPAGDRWRDTTSSDAHEIRSRCHS